METSIHVEQLCKSYQGTQVVKNISFQVKKEKSSPFWGQTAQGNPQQSPF